MPPSKTGVLTGLNQAPAASMTHAAANGGRVRVFHDLSTKQSAHAQQSPSTVSARMSGACASEVRFNAKRYAAPTPARRPPSSRPHRATGKQVNADARQLSRAAGISALSPKMHIRTAITRAQPGGRLVIGTPEPGAVQ